MSLDSASDELRETFQRALRRFPRRCRSSPRPIRIAARDDGDRRDVAVACSPFLDRFDQSGNAAAYIMLLARRFCVNVRADQVPLSNRFSGALPAEERFGLGDWKEPRPEGVTYLADAQINISARSGRRAPTARTRFSSAKRERDSARSRSSR